MATIWLRESLKVIAEDNFRNVSKGFALFMKYCCGWVVTETISTSGSFVSTEKNGSTGAVTAPVKATGTITCDGNPNAPSDGDTFTLDDGYNTPTVFTFKLVPAANTDILTSAASTAAQMSTRITDAILVQSNLGNLWIDAVDAVGSVTLTNWRYDDIGNTTSADDFTPLGAWAVGNMTGGVNGWKLTDATGTPFVVGTDQNKWVLIVDPTNPRNNGIFEVEKVFDANNLQLDFRANKDVGEGFTTATNLVWHMWAGDYQMPTGGNVIGGSEEWWRAASPHSSGWAFEFSWARTLGSQPRWGVRVAADGNWSGDKILGDDPLYGFGAWGGVDVWYPHNVNAKAHAFVTVWVDTAGEFLYFSGQNLKYNSVLPQQSSAWGVTVVDPIEPEAVIDSERVVFFNGPVSIGNTDQTFGGLRTAEARFSRGRCWDERSQSEIDHCYIGEISYTGGEFGWGGADPVIGWKAISGLEANARLVSDPSWQVGKTQRYEGLLVMKDRNNESPIGQYEWLGWMKGCQGVRNICDYVNANQPVGIEVRTMLPMSSDGVAKDWVIWFDGMMLPWPDVTPQGQQH